MDYFKSRYKISGVALSLLSTLAIRDVRNLCLFSILVNQKTFVAETMRFYCPKT
jgi:hypothetical protein